MSCKGFVLLPTLGRPFDDIALNLGPGEALVGIEVLDAKRLLGGGTRPVVALEEVALAAGG